MPISQRRYVDIASAVVGAGGAAMQKLDGRVFTPSTKVFAQQILEFSDASEVAAHFGNGTPEAVFAAQYFALTTPAPVSRARALQFAAHLTTSRSATIYGSADHANISALNLITAGSIGFLLDGVVVDDVVDLSSDASFSDIAATISAGIDIAAAGIVVTYSDGRFVATSAAGTTLEIVGSSTAIALGLSAADAQTDEGGLAQTMAEAWLAAQGRNASYGSAYFIQRAALSECVGLAELNAAENVRHIVYFQVTTSEASSFSAALIDTASCGLVLKTDSVQHLAHIPMALLSATDYSRSNATMNYMFRRAGVTLAPQINSTLDANIYDPLRVNYYGQTAVAGSDIRFFQRGFLCGTASAPQDMSVHGGEQWLKARFTQLWFDLLTETRGIPANLDGKGRAAQVIATVIEEAINNGVILKGKDFSVTQKLAIGDAANDPQAWMQVQSGGAWFSVDIKTRTGEANITEYYLDYVLVYAKGDWVRKVTGSHNLV